MFEKALFKIISCWCIESLTKNNVSNKVKEFSKIMNG